FRRTIVDRVRTLAPMLWYDSDPYPAIVDGRVVWLLDAYTWSDHFPYSEPGWDAEPVWGLNYIRNSVKVTIDAYTGETAFYVVDPSDPLVQTYMAIFPGLFKDGAEMDPALRDHWRYPEQLYTIQAAMFGAYHMQDGRVFYNQEDLWQAPTEILDVGEEAQMAPYYIIMALPGQDQAEFAMIQPYVPAGKQNMIAWLYADSDGEDYGQLSVYKFAKEALVYGPMQVEARFNQDAYISQQLALWNQQGSSVIRGNMLVIPVDGSLIYVEPLFLQAETGRLPELKRVLVAQGNRVAMADTLAGALAQVLGEAPAAAEIEALPEDAAALARSAQAHYEAAQACLQRNDWSCYGSELDALGRDLEALVAATQE
ncbi:MAG: COG1615 family transporter, partial [Anaerolineales bacterium]|nr:COG1615 family transporter [Anaerolineales bacterium]